MKRTIGMSVCIAAVLLAAAAHAQTVAVYPVKTEGFTLNESEVTEISRIALQACFDEGLTCLPRGYTLSHIQKEQALAGGGKAASAPHIAEFALTGKTKGKFDVGVGGSRAIVGAAKRVGGVTVGGAVAPRLKGARIGADGMHLTGQFFRTADGSMVYSKVEKKLGMSGEFIIVSARSSNAQKLHKAFRKIFKGVKGKLAGS